MASSQYHHYSFSLELIKKTILLIVVKNQILKNLPVLFVGLFSPSDKAFDKRPLERVRVNMFDSCIKKREGKNFVFLDKNERVKKLYASHFLILA